MERIKTDNELILATWRECGDNYAQAARVLGLSETMVRDRIMRKLSIRPRPYKRIQVPGPELYKLWLAEGGDRSSARKVALSLGYGPETVRAAIKRHLRSLEN